VALMPVVRDIQPSFTSGEYDPHLHERVDVTYTLSACKLHENVLTLPQGGFRSRDGTPVIMRQRGLVSPVSLASATFTTGNGGTAANLIDGLPYTYLDTTNPIGTTANYVVFYMDYLSAIAPAAVELENFRVSTEVAVTFELQGSNDNINWDAVTTFTTDGPERSRRHVALPGLTLPSYRAWRLIRQGTADLGSATASVGSFAMYSEAAATIGVARVINWTVDADTEYQLIFMHGHVDVIRTRPAPTALVGSVSIPHSDAQLPEIKVARSRDLMLVFHKDVAPWAIFRYDGTDYNWDFRYQVFDSVTTFPWGDATVAGGLDEYQRLEVTGGTTGEEMRFELNGKFSPNIVYNTTHSTFAANVEAALEAMDDITSVTCTALNNGVQVQFDGVDGKRRWPILIPVVVDGAMVPDMARVQGGRPDYSTLWDWTHGFPRAGAFYQGRLWMCGIRDRASAIVASRGRR
jgi:hypothetical protein